MALIRGTCADEDGNISFDKEPMLAEGLAAASAAKNSGGIVIVQVEYLAERGLLRPKDIRIPGVLVDYVVVASDEAACWQSPSEYYDPSLSGQIRKPLRTVAPLPLDEKGDRAALRRGAQKGRPHKSRHGHTRGRSEGRGGGGQAPGHLPFHGERDLWRRTLRRGPVQR